MNENEIELLVNAFKGPPSVSSVMRLWNWSTNLILNELSIQPE